MLSVVFLLSLFFISSWSKVYELYTRDHFHDLIQDLPPGSRYSAVIAFYNHTSECLKSLDDLDYSSSNLPSVDHLMVARYDFLTERSRVWHEYEDHMDLPGSLGVRKYLAETDSCGCPVLVFIPSSYCDEMGEDYLVSPSLDGVTIWDQAAQEEFPNWRDWVWQQLQMEIRIVQSDPFDFQVTVHHQSTNTYHRSQGGEWSVVYDIDSLQSHEVITVYPGDTIYVSQDPELNAHMKRVRKEEMAARGLNPKPTPSAPNPSLTVISGTDVLRLEQLDDGNWGFTQDRDASITPSFVKRRHATTTMTHTRNLVIPKVLPSLHPLGFEKRPMPPGLHERLVRYYRRWYHTRELENWDRVGTQLNYFNVKSHMISLDHDFHERNSIANDVMKPILKQWAIDNGGNVENIEYSAFYGIREYGTNAVLRNHVDRIDTHVLSAILQVGQTGIDKPWPLEVWGFDGKRYRVTLEPGEMILYEGARLIHGRPEPFYGDWFANCFVHFKPDYWDWSTGKVWKSELAKQTLDELHITIRDIYR